MSLSRIFILKEGSWSINCFAHFSSHSFQCTFITKSMKKHGEQIKNYIFSAVLFHGNGGHIHFRAVNKVHTTLKLLLQLQ